MVGPGQVVCLAAGQEEADRVTQRVDQGMYLGAQSAARSPDWSSPALGGAGAMLVGAHDGAVDHRVFVVGIRGEMLKYPFHTPLLAQRLNRR
jgi:hypothetical protein